jgi:hypothetical protein
VLCWDGNKKEDKLKGKRTVHFEFTPLTDWQQLTLLKLKILIIREHPNNIKVIDVLEHEE